MDTLALKKSIGSRLTRNRPNILCLGRPAFSDDLVELNESCETLNFIDLKIQRNPAFILKRSPRFSGLKQWSFFSGEEKTKALFEPATRSVERAVAPYVDSGEIVGFMSANYNYFQDEPFLQASRALLLPFFVLLREHPYSPLVGNYHAQLLEEKQFPRRGHFGLLAGPGSLVYTEQWGGFSETGVELTGFPRLDRVRRLDASAHRKHGLLMFEFEAGPRAPAEQFYPTLQTVLQWCETNGVEMSLRCKNASRARVLEHELRRKGFWPSRSGLMKIAFDDLQSNLATSHIVLGANTMGLYEGLFSSASVISVASDTFSKPDSTEITTEPESKLFSVQTKAQLIDALNHSQACADSAPGIAGHRDMLKSKAFTQPAEGTATRIENVIKGQVGL